jgi:pimeloyl-ACP methyl ester carboxylesterase
MEQKIFFKNSDGFGLCGVLIKPKQETKKCIILCHGMSMDKDENGIFTELAKRLANENFVVFRFDFRGHGESEGNSVDMTIGGEVRDLEAAVKFLQNEGYSEFGILGSSFGGGVTALFCASNPQVAKVLVLWNPGIDYEDRLNPKTEWGKKYWGEPAWGRILKYGFTEIGKNGFKIGKKLFDEFRILKPWKELQRLDIPILFVHGDEDNIVSYDESVKYSQMLKNARLETIYGANHRFYKDKKLEQAHKVTVNFFVENMEYVDVLSKSGMSTGEIRSRKEAHVIEKSN